jgi:glyoxylase-like metal-dependent hydrolase (beta-lactamase superfamily II)
MKNSKKVSSWCALVGVIASCAMLGSCASRETLPPPIAPNVERQALEEIVRGKDAPDDAVILLVGEFGTAGRLRDGYEFFRARAADEPDRPLFAALEGFFQVQLAPEVSVLSRVSYVESALREMDEAVKRAPRSPARLFRAFVLARLPARFGRQAEAVTELEELTSPGAGLPLVVQHDTFLALALAYTAVGRTDDAAKALARSGYPSLAQNPVALTTQISVNLRDGTRYVPPSFVEEAPGVFAAYGYDYGEVYFVVTSAGVVAIDSGSVPARAAQMKARLREHTSLPITHVILTHAHWDHAGGIEALLESGTQVLASAQYPRTLEAMAPFDVATHPGFMGDGATTPRNLHVDVPISEPRALVLGGEEFRLTPLEGAETRDALLIEVPSRHVLFVGDAIADIGVPYVNEGSPEGFLHALEVLARYPADTRFLHGHKPVGDLMAPQNFAPLGRAFSELRDGAFADIRAGRGLAEVLHRGLPEAVKEAPRITLPFLVFREAFLQRLVREHTGYWAIDGDGLESNTRAELGQAIDLVAKHDAGRFAEAAQDLLARGDFALAWKVAELGLAAHPDDASLRDARQRALQKLLERNERWDFFKLTVYAEMTGTAIPPPKAGQ